jgi:hypothetical protein
VEGQKERRRRKHKWKWIVEQLGRREWGDGIDGRRRELVQD